jgi:GNAT superfamily N-acetyltransferase
MYRELTTSKQCGYVSDGGYMCPLSMWGRITLPPEEDQDEPFQIIPFWDLDDQSSRNQVAESLLQHFARSMEVSTVQETIQYLFRNFASATDILYVMYAANTKTVVGTVSVDRKNFHPCIGHLLVVPYLRGRGYGTKLLQFAEKCIEHQKFPEAQLWCSANDTNLCAFYERNGYEARTEKINDDIDSTTSQEDRRRVFGKKLE